MEEGDEGGAGSVWNIDDAQSRLIFEMKLAFIKARDSWNLDEAYWALWRYLTEIKPLFDDPEKDKLSQTFNQITNLRNATNKFSNLDEEIKGLCADVLNDLYLQLNEEAVDKKYFYRKKKEYVGL